MNPSLMTSCHFFLWNSFNSAGRKFQIVPSIKSIFTPDEDEGNSGLAPLIFVENCALKLLTSLVPTSLVARNVTLVVACPKIVGGGG